MKRLYAGDPGPVLDELYRQLVKVQTRRADALAAMERYNTTDPADFDKFDEAAAAHDAASDEFADLNERIEELEGDDTPTGFAAMYFAIK